MKNLREDKHSTLQLAMTIALGLILVLGIMSGDKKVMALCVAVALAVNTLTTTIRYKENHEKFTLIAAVVCGIATLVFGAYYLSL